MHGYQCIIKLGLKLSALCPVTQKIFQERISGIRVCQLQTENHGEQTADESPDDSCYQKLLGNRLVILTEDVFRNESLLMVMVVMSIAMYVVVC